MFASLKNKIREETGSDVVIKVNPPFGKRAPSSRGRHSRTGSTTSLNSIMSTDGVRDDQNVSPISSKFDEEELQKILAKKDAEFEKILKDKEIEWNKQLEERENDKISALKEKEDLDKRILELEELLKITEEQKRKLAAYRDDKEQLESLQAQEIGKVKQLLLQREKELAEKTASLKENTDLVESLRGQISRLRHSEQELSCVQDELETLRHASAREKAALASQLAQSEEETRHLRDRVELLEKRVNNVEADGTEPDDKMKALLSERNLLEQRLEEAHFHLADIKSSWSEKITSLETQVGRLSRQAAEEGTERRRALNERDTLKEKVKQLEFEVEKSKHEIETRETKINRLVTEVDELSAELRDLRQESDEEVTFLRKQIENTDGEVRELRERLANVELRAESVQADYARALATAELEKTTNKQLYNEIEQLRIDLKTEQDKCKELCSSYDKERNDKDATLLRNAQVSQEVEIARQRIANQDTELAELSNRLADLERAVLDKDSQLSKTETEITNLKSNVNKLEEDVLERDKNIKVLQQRLAIMKKTLQRELRSNDSDTQLDNLNDSTTVNNTNSSSSNTSTSAAVLQPTSQTTKYVGTNDSSGTTSSSTVKPSTDDDINFIYLKHVIIKFLTSREYEAKHLTRAVATLLKFSPEEERLLHETLEWKMSWFGSRPKVGNGQLAKAIPPS